MINERGYWESMDLIESHCHDESLMEAMMTLFGLTAYDIGCGDGSYTRTLIENGIACQGMDGSPLTPQITNGLCTVMDFSEPQDLPEVDTVLSLEVGEHIPQEYEQIFLDNICVARRVILSWAVEGQAGNGHVNCRNNDYIINEMKCRGYAYNTQASAELRAASTLPYFKNTLMVFDHD